MRSVKPKRRLLPDEHDDGPFRIFMLTTFWLALVAVVLLFLVPWIWGTALLGLCAVMFLAALVFAG